MTVKNPFAAFGGSKSSESEKKVITFPAVKAEEESHVVKTEAEKKPEPEITEAAETAPEPEKAAEPKAGKSEKQAEADKKDISASIIPIAFKAKDITLQDIADKFSAIGNDEKWENWEKDMRERVDKIEIKRDINLGSARILLEQVTDTIIYLNRFKYEMDGRVDVFVEKTVGLIPRFTTVNGTIGKNEAERKRNIALALEVFPNGGRTKLNIADYTLALTQRKRVVDELYDNLRQKQSALFSYIAIMKMENNIKD